MSLELTIVVSVLKSKADELQIFRGLEFQELPQTLQIKRARGQISKISSKVIPWTEKVLKPVELYSMNGAWKVWKVL